MVETPPTDRAATFNAMSFASPDDGWAVGTVGESLSGSGVDTLIEHWDGSAWTISPTPAIEFSNEFLTGVAAFGSDDAWAVGRQDRYGYGADLPMLFRWDGRTWSAVAAPGAGIPTAIGGSGPDDVWAVGRGVLQHFDGDTWSSLPPLRLDASLVSVTALSPDDAWVAGNIPDDRPGYDHTMHPFVAHWDGTAWSRVRVPHPTTDARLASISASSPNDVWAVGGAAATVKRPRGTFVLHYDGTDGIACTAPTVGRTTRSPASRRFRPRRLGRGPPRRLHQRGLRRLAHACRALGRLAVARRRQPERQRPRQHPQRVAVTDDSVWALGGDGGALAERVDRANRAAVSRSTSVAVSGGGSRTCSSRL